MSIKAEAQKYIDELPDDATWDDLVKNLMRHRKITLGMTDIEVAQDHLSEAELSAVIARLHSSSSRPDDMRNTKTYNPSNSLTASWAMVSLAPLLFISILLAPVGYLLAILGIFFGIKAFFSTGKKGASSIPIIIGIY